ncbi:MULTISPECIES: C40 family peptidase [Actinoalloteichus]|uniref:NlpC/P60 family protein n=1 Tax=Actinoalloteichus fjordicus TaxID=1612552 RepID=A0AAC9LFU7_9PSEU|nr:MULTISPECIES: C40 family peptidase [Actinoalloteichus]APU17053.1 NlpC/P60 family protein [Actinoalloteichus fjordicus]APU23134.1 NlpC/P60 family protein [Actinoalloteichus sp. GBA129-24]
MRKLMLFGFLGATAFIAFLVYGGVSTVVTGGTAYADTYSYCVPQHGLWGGEDADLGERDAATLDDESLEITGQIIGIGQEREESPRAWQIAIQAGKTESNLHNLDYGDRDSLGIFQMRPSMGWGTPAQLQDPVYQINKFYDVLLSVPGWEEMRPGDAAQAVERSAFPDRYHRWESMAVFLISELGGVTDINDCQDLPPADERAALAIDFALDQIGKPYVWGATGPGTFDCSGLTLRAWEAAGVTIPRVSQDQFLGAGTPVPLDEALPGDLIFWGAGRSPRAVDHVALYLGNNEVVHAPQPGDVVQRAPLWDGGKLIPTAIRPGPATQLT